MFWCNFDPCFCYWVKQRRLHAIGGRVISRQAAFAGYRARQGRISVFRFLDKVVVELPIILEGMTRHLPTRMDVHVVQLPIGFSHVT